MIIETEIWKDIPEYEGKYQASNLGKIKSLNHNRTGVSKIMSLALVKNTGYLYVKISKEKKSKTFMVHQLIAITFLNHKIDGLKSVINHKDFNRLNNRIDNLEITNMRTNGNKKHIESSSKYTGVYWSKERSKWQAQIQINGKQIYLGRFNTELEANEAYQKELNLI